MKCMICYKKAEVQAYGNTYCLKCYEDSPYYAEKKVKEEIAKENLARTNAKNETK